MTVYFINSGSGGAAIQAGSNDVRIISVQFTEIDGFQDNGYLYVGFPGVSSMAGGSASTPAAARAGSPAPTASARIAGATLSGTQQLCGAYVVASSTGGYGAVTAVAEWKPQGDLILPPTGILLASGGNYQKVIWFEELRLSWSY